MPTQLKLPGHIRMSDVLNVKHLVPFNGNSSYGDENSRANAFQPGEDDVNQIAPSFMERNEQRKTALGRVLAILQVPREFA